MSPTDSDLLGRYVGQQAEEAFADLVHRHLDLVYSAALRQVDGDHATAADVTQAVFTDLARKAGRLTSHTSLTGWLYTSTRFLAANARRADERRRQREQQALAMNSILPTDPEPDWDQLRPVLDESLHSLTEPDREAVLWRYFEQRSHGEIGTRLGVSENAARMRIDRALDKLRSRLSARGIESTSAALGLMLSQRAVLAAPAGLSTQVSQQAMSQAAIRGVRPLTTVAPWRRWLVPVAVGVVLLSVGILSPRLWRRDEAGFPVSASDARPGNSTVAAVTAVDEGNDGPSSRSAPGTDSAQGIAAQDSSATNVLNLLVLAADSGKPLPNIPIGSWSYGGERRARKEWVTLRDGTCRVLYSDAASELELVTQADGFADTRLVWNPRRGEKIPASYTVRLGRPVKLGGRVVDADGKPVAGAKVGFNHEEDPANSKRPESHEFGWIEVTTDEDGRWEINRIADDMVRRIYGGARHPVHVDAPVLFVGKDSEAERALRSGTHVFHLGRPVTVTGLVVDQDGQPVAGATVASGEVGNTARREGVSDAEGRFKLEGCPSGKTLISAQASGFAVTTKEVELSARMAPVHLVLHPGSLLRLRLVDREGKAVPRAHAWLNTFSQTDPAPAQAEVDLRSDSEGRIVWEEAPDAELAFDLYAQGYMRVSEYKVRPDGEEHVVTMPSGLTVFGTVRNASTGQPIPKFRIITGWPQTNYRTGVTNAAWSTLERFWLNFAGGEFRHTYDEGVIGGVKNPGYILKFEAEGYASYISRIMAADEGEVRLDVSLNPADHREVTVVTPEGKPAAQAELALLGQGGRATYTGGSFDPNNGHGMIRMIADAHGRVTLSTDDTLERVFIVHPSGFADLDPAAMASETTWMLLPWGRIEGQWMIGDQPIPNRELWLQSAEGDNDPFQFEFPTFGVKTDAQGRFSYDRVPPGRRRVVRMTRQDHGNGHTSWRHGRATEVEVKPGEITEVNLGNTGYSASLKLVWPAGLARDPEWLIIGGIHTPHPTFPPDVAGNPEAMARWQQTPEFRAAVLNVRRFELSVLGDQVVAEEVEPGDYEVTLMVMKKSEGLGSMTPVLMGNCRAHVPVEPGSGSLNLGEIILQATPAAGPLTPK